MQKSRVIGSLKRYAMSVERWIHIIRINVNKSLKKLSFWNKSAWKTSGPKMIPEILKLQCVKLKDHEKGSGLFLFYFFCFNQPICYF